MSTLVKPCVRVRKLQQLAKSWGGELLEVNSNDFEKIKQQNTFDDCPFSINDLGILWSEKKVIFSGEVMWTEVVHEMGHVFACLEPPFKSEEYDFFGWEYALAKMLKGVTQWKISNDDYGLADLSCWNFGDLSKLEQNKFLKERLQVAQKKGLISKIGEPRTIR